MEGREDGREGRGREEGGGREGGGREVGGREGRMEGGVRGKKLGRKFCSLNVLDAGTVCLIKTSCSWCIQYSTHSPITGISLLLCVHGECVEAHGAVMVGHHPHIEVIELK